MVTLPEINKIFRTGDVGALRELLRVNKKALDRRPAFAGGNWMHYAASHPHLDTIEYLVSMGFDPDEPGYLHQDRPIVIAARRGHLDIVRFFLDQECTLDSDAAVRNPLFSAVYGGSSDIVRLLLAHGIDATVRYNTDTMDNMDATAFALRHGHTDIANMIAEHIADGDQAKKDALLDEARGVVEEEGPLKLVRIVE